MINVLYESLDGVYVNNNIHYSHVLCTYDIFSSNFLFFHHSSLVSLHPMQLQKRRNRKSSVRIRGIRCILRYSEYRYQRQVLSNVTFLATSSIFQKAPFENVLLNALLSTADTVHADKVSESSEYVCTYAPVNSSKIGQRCWNSIFFILSLWFSSFFSFRACLKTKIFHAIASTFRISNSIIIRVYRCYSLLFANIFIIIMVMCIIKI